MAKRRDIAQEAIATVVVMAIAMALHLTGFIKG